MSKNNIKLFEGKKIRSIWNEKEEEWYFSVVDIVAALTEQYDPLRARKYWNKLKQRLSEEGSQLVTNCHQLKMVSRDGRMRLTDVMTTEQILRLIQSIPSKKAEPFKLWLAEVGKGRIEETIDPEKAFERAAETYLKKGYSEEWVRQRLLSIRIRNDLTNEWRKRGVKKGVEYAILTDEITKAWSGMTTREYKNLKDLKKENLRDNMTDLELVLTMLSEATTKEITKSKNAQGLDENRSAAKTGGRIAGDTRKEIEKRTGKPVITSGDAMQEILENNA